MDPGWRIGLTRENSASSSAVTADNFNSDDTCPSMVWTDEKHRFYLDSLEAEFVNQLHYSTELRNHSRGAMGHAYFSRNQQANVHQTNHFMSASKMNSASSQDFEHSATSFEKNIIGDDASILERKHAMHPHNWHRNSVGSNIEVSDQNFVDENVEERPKGKSRVKRSKSNWS